MAPPHMGRMPEPSFTIFDRTAVRHHRDRAAATVDRVQDVLADMAERLVDRIDDTTVRFTQALDVGGRGVVAPMLRARGLDVVSCDLSPRMAARNGHPAVCADEERLPFGPGAFDLVVANLSLHWVNDLPGALIQLRMALRPGGLLLANFPVLGTLGTLRTALTEAETTLSGGVSPRISPLPELRDLVSLMQRAGFELPVADADEVSLAYADPWALFSDLRAAGETNAVALRDRRPPPRGLLGAALAGVMAQGDRLAATLRLGTVTGWAPGARSAPSPVSSSSKARMTG